MIIIILFHTFAGGVSYAGIAPIIAKFKCMKLTYISNYFAPGDSDAGTTPINKKKNSGHEGPLLLYKYVCDLNSNFIGVG